MPRIWALRKFEASVSAEVGKPTGTLSTRFSTWPSSATSTTSARSGSSRTNSTCLSRTLDFAVSTTPAARVRPDSRPEASVSTVSTDLAWPEAATCASIGVTVIVGEIADLHQRVDEEAQALLGRQPPGRRMRRIDQAGLFQIRHHVAHRRRRQRHRNDARQVARADRLAGRQIALDHLAKNLARALVELRKPDLTGAYWNVVGGHGELPSYGENWPFRSAIQVGPSPADLCPSRTHACWQRPKPSRPPGMWLFTRLCPATSTTASGFISPKWNALTVN